jgi:hypothetical protein
VVYATFDAFLQREGLVRSGYDYYDLAGLRERELLVGVFFSTDEYRSKGWKEE